MLGYIWLDEHHFVNFQIAEIEMKDTNCARMMLKSKMETKELTSEDFNAGL